MGTLKRIIAGGAALLCLGGCASLVINSVIEPAVENLQKQTDLDLVCEGAPAYLLMIDSMLADNPESRRLLLTAAQSYASYTTAMAACGRKDRAVAISEKARNYSLRLLADCLGFSEKKGYTAEELRTALTSCSSHDVPALFWGGYGWALWLQYQEGSPAALAALAKVEQIMLKVVELDEGYYHGAAHLFLGSYYGARSQLLGGKPLESLHHFHRALLLTDRQFLPAQVAFAETYARTTFDRVLFEKLLQEVLVFPLESRPDLALANQIAKKKAAQLRGDIDLYF
ncbi:MAG: hypothetical protein HY885_12310 [Deltaproteobacteria bacterium]|nr:hypothetical protein [Deltaproteobacteria bacterium]